MNKKDKAATFLPLVSCGDVHKAYEHYIHPQFRHHDAYFKGDRESLRKAMEEHVKEFPRKSYEGLRVLEDGDLVWLPLVVK